MLHIWASPYYSKSIITPDLQIGESSISPTTLLQSAGLCFINLLT